MSWPQWQPPAQPTLPMVNTQMPMGIQYTPEQWQQMQQQNWQQWAQWQQQYQQWHQQYGAEYQKSLTAMANMGAAGPVMNTAVPPPLPNEAKPPPPPDEPCNMQQKLPAHQPPSIPPNQQNAMSNMNNQPSNTKNTYGYNTLPDKPTGWTPPLNNPINNRPHYQGKRQALEHHAEVASSKKNKLDWQPPPTATQAPPAQAMLDSRQFAPTTGQQQQQPENTEDLSDPEKKFIKQFAEWEAQFNKWKDQNQDHPDKAQYREYEKKWEAWRNQLLERRELMRKKRLGLIPANVNINTSLDINSAPNVLPANVTAGVPSSAAGRNVANAEVAASLINPINAKALATLFKNNLNDGIPGLDLVDAPAQPDDVPSSDKGAVQTNQPKQEGTGDGKPALNLDVLSKNLNSILGDQKLLSMLSLVAQTTSVKPEAPPTPTQNTTPSGITLAPSKVVFDDQASNWSMNTNASANSAHWSQVSTQGRDQKFVGPNSNANGNRFGFANQAQTFGMNDSQGQGSFDSRGAGHGDYGNNYSENERDIKGQGMFEDFDRDERNEGRFMSNNSYSQNSYDESYWSPNGQMDLQNDMVDVAPAPPSIASFDELLQIDKIVDYDHKTKKQDTTDVRVFTPRLFDYRHKLVTRIPIPERPKWLSATYHNIPEFDPPISRLAPPYLRPAAHVADRYHSPGPSGPLGNHYNDGNIGNSFSRRPPPLMSVPVRSTPDYEKPRGPDDDFRMRINAGNNKDDFESFKRQKWGGRDNRDNRNDERERNRDNDRDRSRSRDNRDRDADRNNDVSFNKSRDGKRDGKDAPAPGSGAAGANVKKDTFNAADSFKGAPNMNSFSQNQHLFSSALKINENVVTQRKRTNIDDILIMPGRARRPPRIVIILRGPPGSGKTFLAKQIKDKETENGGSAPRILSLDDYFMVEQEKEVVEDGKTVKVKEMVYEYEECMEASYRESLLKTFKKTITDGFFPFIIVDNVNDKVKYFADMWSFSKQNGFQVYICEMDLNVELCTKRNTHGRSEVEIEHIVNCWEATPSHYFTIDATNLIQSGSIAEVEMEEINSPNEDFDDEENEEQACNSSKWDNFECSIDNLAKLDGINKPLRSARTMEDYLQLDEYAPSRSETKPGQKRVRWADLEESKEQEKLRAIGFVVGQTDWRRMMDPTQGGSALTKTKYIERVGVRKVNTN